MSSLRERVEGLRELMVKATTTHAIHLNDPDHPNYQKADYCRLCWELSSAEDDFFAAAMNFVAALAAEGQEAPTITSEQEQVSGDKEDSITRRLREAREAATLAEHKSHVDFENELYATLVDPVAEGPIKESRMRKQLLESARWYRQRVHELEAAAAPSPHKEEAGGELVELGQELSDSIGLYALALASRADGDSVDDEEIGAAIKRCVAAKRAWDAAASPAGRAEQDDAPKETKP